MCSFVQAREPSLFQSCSLPSTSLSQSSLTARGRKLYALRMASVYLETLFHLYKNPVQCGKQRTPVSPESQPQYCKCARDGTAFCHNLSNAVRQRFAAYYPGRKTQRERSATTGSAGVMRILSCCSHNQPAEVEEKSFLPAFFYGIYSVANLVCFHVFRFSQNHSFISTNPHFYKWIKLPLKTNVCSDKIYRERMFVFFFRKTFWMSGTTSEIRLFATE